MLQERHVSPVSVSAEVLDGEPVFTGTRLPVRAFLEHLHAGDSVEVFLRSFPRVTREQVADFLEQSTAALIAEAGCTWERVDAQADVSAPLRNATRHDGKNAIAPSRKREN